MAKTKDQDRGLTIAEQIGQIRYGLIAPLILGTYDDVSKAAYCRRVSEQLVQMPNGTDRHFAAKTLMRWYEICKANGPQALIPSSRDDCGRCRALSDEAQERIRQLRAQFPKMNCEVIHERLIAEDLILSAVSVRSVQRFVSKLRTSEPLPGQVKDRKAFEAPYPGALWMADTKYYPYLTEDGQTRRAYMIVIIDDYSRMITGCELFYEDNCANFLKVLKRAVKTYGIPHSIYVDHGSPYCNGSVESVCLKLGIVLKKAPVRDGAAKGKVERLHRTLGERLILAVDAGTLSGLDEYNELAKEEVLRYSRQPHSTTGERPYERYMNNMDAVRVPPSEAWLEECFELSITRKVRNDSTVSIKTVSYDVPPQFAGQTVELRYKPDAPDSYTLLFEGRRYTVRRTDRHENYRTKRKSAPDINYGLEVPEE